MEKLSDPNKQKFEPFADLVDTALCNLHATLSNNQDSYAQQENDEVVDMLQATSSLIDEDPEDESVVLDDDPSLLLPKTISFILSDDDINDNICSLNSKQRAIYNVIIKWAREYTKNRSTLTPTVIKPLYMFITGNGGCGKSHLAKTIYHSVSKTLSYHAGEPEKSKVLVLAPTGVAAVNVYSLSTWHSGWKFSKAYPKT